MSSPVFDLQSHSTCSDGVLAPAEVVELAARSGVELLALTDHDTVDGVAEAAAAARDRGIALTPAAELSAVDGVHEDVHVCGYELDITHPGLLAALEDFRADRARRVEEMADRLREHGFALADDVLRERRAAGLPLGRPHLADAVLRHPGNSAQLADEGIDGRDALFAAYLVPGARAFVARRRPTVADAIALIHDAGGVAVWAHPFWDLDDPQTALGTLARYAHDGLDGVECFYATHTREQTELLHAECTRRGLLITGSADFHGPRHEHFNGFRAFETYGMEPVLGPIGARSGAV
jgi:3',5'-nucleoside bisphosphate phosphatase